MNEADLADACQALAEKLTEKQAELNYEGEQAAALGKRATDLSAQASTLRTFVVSQAIAESVAAMDALKDGTAAANTAVKNIEDAVAGLEIAGLLLSLGTAVISADAGGIVSAGSGLVDAVNQLGA